MKNKRTILTGVARTVVDFFVLPGTSNSAEILWLYGVQWKRSATLIAVALISFMFSHIQSVETASRQINEPENTR